MSFHLKFHLKLWQNDIGLDSDNGINNTESPWEVGNLLNALVLQVSEGPSSTLLMPPLRLTVKCSSFGLQMDLF